ncbi:UDP-N-acetylmuramoyl-tripeptide--D-alanyl-D-alanine ligase [Candidatus Dojkabacteria bacterium]|uniref:UDP-N-acetylmuramoyl-tripeptide--D-alanyl-D-alanine ligase n=1 Tax=Candidatus Dojkabacteria bacterium TaxID=2099670 RepID=A0A955KVC3_9BACT|nr:UDP-N-acetylmuramoyl-tripeptide--D-alanyl-D-alanine ligase [Candidatus Dojkabacteria bacterium]MCB9790753.1 UDP-N-acetylmuramoyl-tripeptide--D-alanyl-D-alanine ligase [Candidatus Nomurabacteria bacterium]
MSVIFSLGLLSSLPWLYYLQVKDYFYLRVVSGLKEQGLKPLFWFLPFKIPAKSLRNILVLIISFLSLILIAYVMSLNSTIDYQEILILGVSSYFFSRLVVLVTVILTEPLAYLRREMLIKQASKMVLSSNAVFIGVTGSYGKSSTKEFIAEILASEFHTGKSVENYNSEVGVAISVLRNLEPDKEYFVSEMGAYTKGTIAKSASIVKPKMAVLTGLGNQHLDTFGSRANIIEAKSELLRALPPDGIAYINIDCEGYKKALEYCNCKTVTYSISNHSADVFAAIDRRSSNEIYFSFKYGEIETRFETHLPGLHNVLNLLPGIAIALDQGIEITKIQKSLSSIAPLKGRLSSTTRSDGVEIVDDSYNNSLMGFSSAVDVMKIYPARKKILITKGIIELGKEKKSSYEHLTSKLQGTDIKVFTTDQELANCGEGIEYVSSEKELLSALSNILDSGDLLLIKGRFSPNFMKQINRP